MIKIKWAYFKGLFLRSQSNRPRRQVAMGAPRAGKSREGMVFIVETFSGTDSVSQVAKIKGTTSQNIFNFVTALVSQQT